MATAKPLMKTHPWKFRIGERRAVLVGGDLLMGVVAMGLALFLWGASLRFIKFDLNFLQNRVPLWFYFLPLVWIVLMVELYDVHRAGDWWKTVQGIATAVAGGAVAYLVLYFFFVRSPDSLLPRRSVAIFLVSVALLTLVWRSLYIRIFTDPQFMRRVLLVGAGSTGEMLLGIINEIWPPPFVLAGIIDDDPQKQGRLIQNLPVLSDSGGLLAVIEEKDISDVIVAISGEMQGCMFQALLDAQERGVEIIRMPVVYEELLGRVPIRVLEADWILRSFVDTARVSGFYLVGKRLLDILGGLVGCLGLVLAFPFVSLAILLDDGRPIFYGQTRSGRGGQPYRILKFRTMRRDAEADGKPKWAKEDDERATRIGRFLRKAHLDELPQFFNVLRGDMSLVGPRPERPELVEMFERHVPFYRARLLVKPGITGWAQVNFGYASTVDETITKLEFDLYYIKHRNMIIDLVILLRTPATFIGFRGR